MARKRSADTDPESTFTEVRSYFVRGRNVLITRANFGELYTDYYLHLMQHNLKYEPAHDLQLKEAMAAITLHLTSRPWNEVSAWTFHFENPLLNLFVSGGSLSKSVVGRVFTDEIREMGSNLLHSQVTREQQPLRNSSVEFQGRDVFSAVEQYYKQSEQRPARYFHYDTEDIVLACAQPDYDRDWFNALDNEKIHSLDADEDLSLLEQRHFGYQCGCNEDRINRMLLVYPEKDLEEIFDNSDFVLITCPRCAAKFKVTIEDLHAHREKLAQSSVENEESEEE